MAPLQIIWDGGEVFQNIVGTRDLAIAITGLFWCTAGLLVSILVPDIPVPASFGSINIPGTGKKICVGGICSLLYLHVAFSYKMPDSNLTLFCVITFAVGLLNFHLLPLLYNMGFGALSKITGQNNTPPNKP